MIWVTCVLGGGPLRGGVKLPGTYCHGWGVCIDGRQQKVSCLQSEQEETGVTSRSLGDSFLEPNSRPRELADPKPSSYNTDGRTHQGDCREVLAV